MRSSLFLSLLLCLCVSTAASADEITAVRPSQIYIYSAEQTIAIIGSGLTGNVETHIVLSGNAGTFTVDPVDGDSSMLIFEPPSALTAVVGTYSITVLAVDDNGTRTIGGASFDVINFPTPPSPPSINVPEFLVVEATGANGAVVNYDVSAQSSDGTPLTPSCSPPSGSLFGLGDTFVTCSVSDANGTTNGFFNVVVTDSTPPVITVPADITSASSVVTYSVTSVDAVSGNITNTDPVPPNIVCSPASGSTFPAGTTTVSCSSTDAHGNTSRASFHVTVGALPPPTLTLPSTIVAEATEGEGAVVTFSATANQGATVDCSPASGSTFNITTTTVDCTATNSEGGSSSGSFDVIVRDTTAPSLSLPSTITVQAADASGAVVNYTATSSDIVDGSAPINCSPASGSLFAVGTTTVSCSSADSHGNIASGTFDVVVKHGEPPHLEGLNDITAEATSPAGAVVTFNVTATGHETVTCTPPSGSTFALGQTTVSCSATNNNGTSTGTFNVTVVDTTPPSLVLPSNITTEATSPSGAVVTFTASATDIVDGSVTVVCSPASGSTFPLGTTTVGCSATDSHHNSSNGAFTVTVQDTTAPTVLSISATPNTLWPPDHKMVDVVVSVTAFDAVDPAPVSHIVSVTSNQPINGTSDGDASPDWVINGSMTLQLRSERAAKTDRIYTITVETTDSSGNTTTSTVKVTVTQTNKRRAA